MVGIQVNITYVGEEFEVTIIDVQGYIDTSTAPEINRVLNEQLSRGKYYIIINLEAVDYISSTGWGVFIGDLKEIRNNGGDLVLVNMSVNVHNIFELMEFSSLLNSFQGVENAVAYFLREKIVKKKARLSNQKGIAVNDRTGVRAAVSSSKEEKVVPISPYIKQAEKERDSILSFTHTELGKRILKVILAQPYLDVKEITKALMLPQYGGIKVKQIAVKRELKYMDLIDKQKRFEFAMKNR